MGTSEIICLLALLSAADKSAADKFKGEPLRGKVYAADGSPVAGAVVWAAKLDQGPLERRETVADAKGDYELDLGKGRWWVWARRGTQGGEGIARHETIEIDDRGAPNSVIIRMEERGTFRGRLFQAETGKPISGGRFFLDNGVVLNTDDQGRFELGGLDRSNHEAYVVAPRRMRMRVLFDTTAHADTELEVPVPRAGKIVGRVTDADGKPIPGAYVWRPTSGSHFSLTGLVVSCDAEGRFEYDDAVPPDQPTRLTGSAPGYVDGDLDDLYVSPDGKPLVLDFRLRRKPDDRPNAKVPDDEKRRVVSGVVRGPDGKPVASVVVRWGYKPYVGAIQTKTDQKGRFRFTVPDKADLVAVLPRELAPEFLPVAAGSNQEVEVELRAGHTARGKVLDDTGKPIKEVDVIAVVSSPDPRIGNPFWLRESEVRTDGNGKFEMKGVPDGAQFDFLKSGLSDLRNHHLDLASADNIVTMRYGGAISGRVVDREGKPIRNFRVLVGFPHERRPDDQSGGFFAGYCGIGVRFTSADGSFVLTGVGAGSVHRIMALADGHGEAVADRVTVVPINHLETTKPVTLQAGPPVALRVRAVTAKDKPIAEARVTLVNGEPGLDQQFSWGYHNASWEDMVRCRTGADGWAHFPVLSFASATVLVQAPGYGRQRLGWRDGQKELTVELAPEAVLSGDVRDATGKPVRAFFVNLTSGGDQISTSVGSADKGRFRVAELPAGSWTISIRDSDGPTELHQRQITLKAGEIQDLKIETKKE
jgi:uncharacterized GH25 family protein